MAIDSGNGWNRLPRELHDEILRHLSLPDLAVLSRVKLALSQGHLVGRIVRLLERFYLDYEDVMTMLKEMHSRITGLAVLEIVKPSKIPDSTLDFVVAQGFHSDAMKFFNGAGYTILEQSERLQVQLNEKAEQEVPLLHSDRADPSIMYLPDETIVEVINLIHPQHGGRITLIYASTTTSLVPILTFSTKLLMNWITHNTVACAYPDLTVGNQGFHNTLPWWTHPKTEAALDYYRQIGFTILDKCTQLPYHSQEDCNSSRKGWGLDPETNLSMIPYCQRRLRFLNNGITAFMPINSPLWWTIRGSEDSEKDVSWRLCRRSEGRELRRIRAMRGEIAGAHQSVVYFGTDEYHRIVQPPV
ncbi:hypothetical protein BKA70DRAFT_1450077 [Coprinopsis sp. MPI-PUGE-AT-0042]|nr:hypothetical protein BKA70DRAFT_1450077 [Coprinopsis sp. MPI-PUGE-AT-0042]